MRHYVHTEGLSTLIEEGAMKARCGEVITGELDQDFFFSPDYFLSSVEEKCKSCEELLALDLLAGDDVPAGWEYEWAKGILRDEE